MACWIPEGRARHDRIERAVNAGHELRDALAGRAGQGKRGGSLNGLAGDGGGSAPAGALPRLRRGIAPVPVPGGGAFLPAAAVRGSDAACRAAGPDERGTVGVNAPAIPASSGKPSRCWINFHQLPM